MAIIVVIVLACLSYLALSSGTAKVLNWILKYIGPFCNSYDTSILTEFPPAFVPQPLCSTGPSCHSHTFAFTTQWKRRRLTRSHSYLWCHDYSRMTDIGHSSGPSSSFGKWRAFRWTWEACYWWELLVCLTFGLTCENYRVQGYAVFLDGKWEVATFVFNYGIVSLASVICLLSYTDYTAIADRTSYCHRDFLEDLQAHKVAQVQGCWPSQRPGVLRGFGWTLPPGTGEWPSFQVR